MPLDVNPTWLGLSAEDALLGRLRRLLGDAAPPEAQEDESEPLIDPASALHSFPPTRRRRLYVRHPGLWRLLGGHVAAAPAVSVHPYLAVMREKVSATPAEHWPLWRLCMVLPGSVGIPQSLPTSSNWQPVRRMLLLRCFSRARRLGRQSFLTALTPGVARLWTLYVNEAGPVFERANASSRQWRYVHLRHRVRAALAVATPCLSPVRYHLLRDGIPEKSELTDWVVRRQQLLRTPGVPARVRALWRFLPRSPRGGIPQPYHEYLTRHLMHKFLPGMSERDLLAHTQMDWDYDTFSTGTDELGRAEFARFIVHSCLCYCETSDQQEFRDFLTVIETHTQAFMDSQKGVPPPPVERQAKPKPLRSGTMQIASPAQKSIADSKPTSFPGVPTLEIEEVAEGSFLGASVAKFGSPLTPVSPAQADLSSFVSSEGPTQGWRSVQQWLKDEPPPRLVHGRFTGVEGMKSGTLKRTITDFRTVSNVVQAVGAQNVIETMQRRLKSGSGKVAGRSPRPAGLSGLQGSSVRPRSAVSSALQSPVSASPLQHRRRGSFRIDEANGPPTERRRRRGSGVAQTRQGKAVARARVRWTEAGRLLRQFRRAADSLQVLQTRRQEYELEDSGALLDSSETSSTTSSQGSTEATSNPQTQESESATVVSLDIAGRYPPLFPAEQAVLPCVLRAQEGGGKLRRAASAQPRRRTLVDSVSTLAATRGIQRMLPCTPDLMHAAAATPSPRAGCLRDMAEPKQQLAAVGGLPPRQRSARSPAAPRPASKDVSAAADHNVARWSRYSQRTMPPRAVFLRECSLAGVTPAAAVALAIPADALGWRRLLNMTLDGLPATILVAACAVASACPSLRSLTLQRCAVEDEVAAGLAAVSAAERPLKVSLNSCSLSPAAAEWVAGVTLTPAHRWRIVLAGTQLPPLLQRRVEAAARRGSARGTVRPGMSVE